MLSVGNLILTTNQIEPFIDESFIIFFVEFIKICSTADIIFPAEGEGYNTSRLAVQFDSKACFGLHTRDLVRLIYMRLNFF